MENRKDNSILFNHFDSKNSVVFKLFEKDNHLLFLYRKVEKIVAAIYLLSALFPENEPIKFGLRNDGVHALSLILLLTPGEVLHSDTLYNLSVCLTKISTQLDISHLSGYISEMNYRIIKSELNLLVTDSYLQRTNSNTTVGRKVVFDRDFFGIEPEKISSDYIPKTSVRSEIDETADVTGHDLIHTWQDVVKVQTEITKKQIKNTQESKGSEQDIKETYKGHISDNIDRQSVIIDILRSRDSLNVRDFTSVIKGVSTKTIQRELLRLVSIGVLKKEGERRWSRYSLANA